MVRPLAAATAVTALLALAACGTTYEVPLAPQMPPGVGVGVAAPAPQIGTPRAYAAARADWNRVVSRVEPAAERFCREELQGQPRDYCDFQIRLIEDRRAPPNAFQTIGRDGRPLIVMTSALLGDTRSADEIAFVLSHEAGHHVAGHLARQQVNVAAGALILGTLAGALGGGGQSEALVRDAMDLGAFAGQRAYSQRFELEADTVGAFIAARAGFRPEQGALMFYRTPSAAGAQSLWSTHPPSMQRLGTVQRAAEEIRRQEALGQVPRPGQARGRL
jgi:Zn-dependent protease with chaperone function